MRDCAVFLALSSLATISAFAHNLNLTATYPDISQCALEPSIYSCENTTAIKNTCCSPTPGGLVLHTQFWSTYTGLEEQGQRLPKGSWTIHGLWPDNCDGSFEQYCDMSRQFDPEPSPAKFPNGTTIPPYEGPGVDTFVKAFGRDDLLEIMEKYWINQGAPNNVLWAHEFSKHATCTSTFDIACYGDAYEENMELVNYFDAVMRSFHHYPTFDILAAYVVDLLVCMLGFLRLLSSAGIVPSNSTGYNLTSIQNALKSQTGALPYLGCKNQTILSEVWYFSHVYGTEQYGSYKNLDSTSPTSCAANQTIWYYERTPAAEVEVRKSHWW
ncbi:hypothetical protein V5O48_003522 [Marasmius crinis-equi]|uniref:ribonuclease T2 n=1 Tax=Marasmius crinis-equi TaxID=585013 RepID=A0ABR3FSM2_9AGAR